MPASTNTRTSHSHPLQINALSARSGLLGLTFCPGKKQALPASGTAWDRQLDVDIAALQQWQTALLLSLVEPDELDVLTVQAAGIDWLLLPIVDQQVPDAAFEAAWQRESSRLHALLDAGQRIVIHCKGGLGRTGTIAARLLIESGVETEAAIRQVRMARPGAIENDMQEAYVRGLARRGVAR
jgi:ADP-ribosyl-[dinitrogen reductase] hydrolase